MMNRTERKLVLECGEEYRGIGVRIEDDILVTETGAENLSLALPREADDVEAWVRRLRGKAARVNGE